MSFQKDHAIPETRGLGDLRMSVASVGFPSLPSGMDSLNFMEARVEIFTCEHEPQAEQLRAACDLFRRNIPVFDAKSHEENAASVALRATPDAYRTLLKTKTLLLALDMHDRVMGLLEWDRRKAFDPILAYMSWLIIDRPERGRGLSTRLHDCFESVCVPRMREETRTTVHQVLGVHRKNPAQNIYQKWGYRDAPPQWNDARRLFMIKKPSFQETEVSRL